MGKELYALLGIEKKESSVISAFSDDVLYSQLDTDHLDKWYMLDGTIDNRQYPFRRYSTYLQNIANAAADFGYTFKEYYKYNRKKTFHGLDGSWVFRNPDGFYYPWISVRPGSVHDQFTLVVHMDYDMTLELKTYQDCYKHIRERLELGFKSKGTPKEFLRQIKLTDLGI